MSLLHINLFVMVLVCVLLLVGFALRDYFWGPGMMLLGALALMLMILYDIRVLSAVA